mmetsp:Transcript_42774/g.35937  ORF Transcript_42774/g.35937 Transcript_42774/m.35937 type:complete len:210 (+) Transcript_42774:815-1444(+)
MIWNSFCVCGFAYISMMLLHMFSKLLLDLSHWYQFSLKLSLMVLVVCLLSPMNSVCMEYSAWLATLESVCREMIRALIRDSMSFRRDCGACSHTLDNAQPQANFRLVSVLLTKNLMMSWDELRISVKNALSLGPSDKAPITMTAHRTFTISSELMYLVTNSCRAYTTGSLMCIAHRLMQVEQATFRFHSIRSRSVDFSRFLIKTLMRLR